MGAGWQRWWTMDKPPNPDAYVRKVWIAKEVWRDLKEGEVIPPLPGVRERVERLSRLRRARRRRLDQEAWEGIPGREMWGRVRFTGEQIAATRNTAQDGVYIAALDAATTYGNLDRATNPFWRAQPVQGQGLTYENLRGMMRNIYNEVALPILTGARRFWEHPVPVEARTGDYVLVVDQETLRAYCDHLGPDPYLQVGAEGGYQRYAYVGHRVVVDPNLPPDTVRWIPREMYEIAPPGTMRTRTLTQAEAQQRYGQNPAGRREVVQYALRNPPPTVTAAEGLLTADARFTAAHADRAPDGTITFDRANWDRVMETARSLQAPPYFTPDAPEEEWFDGEDDE